MPKKVPSYKGLRPASETASKIKKNNKRTDTKHELLLRSTLWKMGLRFRKNVNTLPGKPDIVFPKTRVVVFCDGDFWHGRNWDSLKNKLKKGTNAKYWQSKIAANMERDKRTTAILQESGWYVIRVWEKDIKRDASSIANTIKLVIDGRRET